MINKYIYHIIIIIIVYDPWLITVDKRSIHQIHTRIMAHGAALPAIRLVH